MCVRLSSLSPQQPQQRLPRGWRAAPFLAPSRAGAVAGLVARTANCAAVIVLSRVMACRLDACMRGPFACARGTHAQIIPHWTLLACFGGLDPFNPNADSLADPALRLPNSTALS